MAPLNILRIASRQAVRIRAPLQSIAVARPFSNSQSLAARKGSQDRETIDRTSTEVFLPSFPFPLSQSISTINNKNSIPNPAPTTEHPTKHRQPTTQTSQTHKNRKRKRERDRRAIRWRCRLRIRRLVSRGGSRRVVHRTVGRIRRFDDEEALGE